jgi:hypothetical protein
MSGAQDVRRNGRKRPLSAEEKYQIWQQLLSGVARCAECDGGMKGTTTWKGDREYRYSGLRAHVAVGEVPRSSRRSTIVAPASRPA